MTYERQLSVGMSVLGWACWLMFTAFVVLFLRMSYDVMPVTLLFLVAFPLVVYWLVVSWFGWNGFWTNGDG